MATGLRIGTSCPETSVSIAHVHSCPSQFSREVGAAVPIFSRAINRISRGVHPGCAIGSRLREDIQASALVASGLQRNRRSAGAAAVETLAIGA